MKNFILKICKPNIIWYWDDFGIMFRIYRHAKRVEYYMSIDIQIAWLNIWIQCFRKTNWKYLN